MTDLTDLPLRDELRGLRPYGARDDHIVEAAAGGTRGNARASAHALARKARRRNLLFTQG